MISQYRTTDEPGEPTLHELEVTPDTRAAYSLRVWYAGGSYVETWAKPLGGGELGDEPEEKLLEQVDAEAVFGQDVFDRQHAMDAGDWYAQIRGDLERWAAARAEQLDDAELDELYAAGV